MWYRDGHMDGGWGVAMALGMMGVWVALIAAVVFAIVWVARSTRSPAGPAGPVDGPGGTVTGSAEQILAERLARGEIDAEEYRTRRDALTPRSRP